MQDCPRDATGILGSRTSLGILSLDAPPVMISSAGPQLARGALTGLRFRCWASAHTHALCHCFSHAQPGRLRQCAEINGQSSGHRSMHCSNHSLTRRGLPRPWQHLALSTGACCTSATSPGAPATGFLYLFEAAQEHSVLGGRWNLTCTWVKAPRGSSTL